MEHLIDKDTLARGIENLKSNLIYGACASQIAMETCCKEEAYNEVLSFIDTLKTKDVENSNNAFIEKACDAYCKVCGHYPHTVPTHICRHDCEYFSDFEKYMKGEYKI